MNDARILPWKGTMDDFRAMLEARIESARKAGVSALAEGNVVMADELASVVCALSFVLHEFDKVRKWEGEKHDG